MIEVGPPGRVGPGRAEADSSTASETAGFFKSQVEKAVMPVELRHTSGSHSKWQPSQATVVRLVLHLLKARSCQWFEPSVKP